MMGYRQTVRQRTLTPSVQGSNPCSPARKKLASIRQVLMPDSFFAFHGMTDITAVYIFLRIHNDRYWSNDIVKKISFYILIYFADHGRIMNGQQIHDWAIAKW